MKPSTDRSPPPRWLLGILGVLFTTFPSAALFVALTTAPSTPLIALIFMPTLICVGATLLLGAVGNVGADGNLPQTAPPALRLLHRVVGVCAGLGFVASFTAFPLSGIFKGPRAFLPDLGFAAFALLLWMGLVLALDRQFRRWRQEGASDSVDEPTRIGGLVAGVLGLSALACFASVFTSVALGFAGPVSFALPLPMPQNVAGSSVAQAIGRLLFAAPAALLWFLFFKLVLDGLRKLGAPGRQQR